ncbi:MAG: phosphatidylserine decarboxylase family protein [Candidatus Marinimicrobia bacterium]|nr:phosphatidylserine decarboxylase family protein [Candidatus Neomarinimicrobiota bacterium]MCK4447492.1 phosphatidylserine decarboxylase family protein [Candidatus Neomarinimicrobiota bacterium]
MIAREGIRVILPIFFIAFILSIFTLLSASILLRVIFWISLILFLPSIYFFRDPNRLIPDRDNAIISPADGKVVAIENTEDGFVGKGKRISIFMSIFNVHVNRVPFGGIVKKVNYKKGKFLAAYKSIASFENERSEISIDSDRLKFTVTQIAGLIARRIVSYLSVGDAINKGDRYGMIMFGSRVDLVIPENVKIKVQLGDKVKGGESIIGEIL